MLIILFVIQIKNSNNNNWWCTNKCTCILTFLNKLKNIAKLNKIELYIELLDFIGKIDLYMFMMIISSELASIPKGCHINL